MAIHDRIVGNWGVTIILFSMLLKVLLLPVGKLTVHFQRSVSQVHSKLEPLLAEIKANYKGEEAHQRMMEAGLALLQHDGTFALKILDLPGS